MRGLARTHRAIRRRSLKSDPGHLGSCVRLVMQRSHKIAAGWRRTYSRADTCPWDRSEGAGCEHQGGPGRPHSWNGRRA